jgi:hypothetical protein
VVQQLHLDVILLLLILMLHSVLHLLLTAAVYQLYLHQVMALLVPTDVTVRKQEHGLPSMVVVTQLLHQEL